jgi:hypothetical protein
VSQIDAGASVENADVLSVTKPDVGNRAEIFILPTGRASHESRINAQGRASLV